MNKQNRLILVDGSAYIFRAYYALPSMIRKDGTPVNAVFGFTNMLIKLIEDYKDEKLIVIFDAARENFRNKIFPNYKANRGETPEDLIPQFDLIKKCVAAFNIPQIELEGYEADDIIATYSAEATKLDIQSLIVSSDKDLMQLVNDKVEMLDPMKNKKIGIEQVIEKFGVEPKKVVQIQALTGDKVDNIPGAPGIGPKTALELINKYGDIDGLIKNADKIKQEKRKNIIRNSENDIRVSLELVKLDHNVNLTLPISKIKSFSELNTSKDSINKFLNAQGFKAIQQRLDNNSLINKNIVNDQNKKNEVVKKFQTINKIDDFKIIISEIKKIGFVAIDIETNSLSIEKAKLVGISLCYDETNAFYLPINHKDIKTNKKLNNQIDENKVLEKIREICLNPAILKIGQNIKYDIRILNKYGVEFQSFEDTMLMSYSLDNGLTRHGMDDLAYRHFSHSTIKFKDIVGTGKKQITFDQVAINEATKYAAEDALITLKLYNYLQPRVVIEKSSIVYNKIDRPLIEVLCSMEEKGIKVNQQYLNKLSSLFLSKSKKIEKEIYKITNKEFNIGSPKQLGEILFLNMKIQGGKKTKTGIYSTDSSILEDLALRGYKIAKLILEWRELTKLRSTYTEALQDQIDEKSKRVHTSYATATTLTGRLSSNDPNLQNIPIRTERGKQIRHAFIPKKGYKIVSFDYSQIELRLAAEISKDNNFITLFVEGKDIHSSTAKEIFNIKDKDLNSEHRRKAKAINFGILYGISPYGLAKQLSISNSEAKQYIENYFKRFPKIRDYMNFQINHAKTNNYVETIFGRRCNIKGINDKNFAVRGFAERQSINAPIQGTAADIIKLSMIEIHKDIQEKKINARMILQVHDELVFEIEENKIKKTILSIKRIMEKTHLKYKDFIVPLTVDHGIGNDWGESH
ncbi:DNA polymerase I [Alphaproteobacteria bacterium]|nr:DNA polymerase I [Alphaproteobacteria bacterium]